jgi:hypothetical protein
LESIDDEGSQIDGLHSSNVSSTSSSQSSDPSDFGDTSSFEDLWEGIDISDPTDSDSSSDYERDSEQPDHSVSREILNQFAPLNDRWVPIGITPVGLALREKNRSSHSHTFLLFTKRTSLLYHYSLTVSIQSQPKSS